MKRYFIIFAMVALLITSLSSCFQIGNNNDNEDITTVSQSTENVKDSEETTTEANIPTDRAVVQAELSEKYKKDDLYILNSNADPYFMPEIYRENNKGKLFYGTLDEEQKPVIYIEEWNEYHVFSPVSASPITEYTPLFGDYANCVYLPSESKGIFAVEHDLFHGKIDIYTFSKGSDEYEKSTITVPIEVGIGYLYFDFIDAEKGFMFVFDAQLVIEYPSGSERLLLYKTADGGKTWTMTLCDDPVVMNEKEPPACVKFFDENIGIVSGRCYLCEWIEERTSITFDGGKTWDKFPSLPCPAPDTGYTSEIIDFKRSNGTYTLKAYIRIYDDKLKVTEEKIVEYTSDNMKDWTLNAQETYTKK